jgi:hypothetical protein
VIPFPVIMQFVVVQRSFQRTLPNRISFATHSSLTDLTQRSAYAFRLGFLGGRARAFTFSASISWQNDEQYLLSRSWSKYLLPTKKPVSSTVISRAICSIQS